MCPAALPLSLGLQRIVSSRNALTAASDVLCGRGEEWVASGRCVRVLREGNVQRLLWLRSRGSVAGVRLRRGLVVRIMDHRTVGRSLEGRLTGVHGVPVDLGASEMGLILLSVGGPRNLADLSLKPSVKTQSNRKRPLSTRAERRALRTICEESDQSARFPVAVACRDDSPAALQVRPEFLDHYDVMGSWGYKRARNPLAASTKAAARRECAYHPPQPWPNLSPSTAHRGSTFHGARETCCLPRSSPLQRSWGGETDLRCEVRGQLPLSLVTCTLTCPEPRLTSNLLWEPAARSESPCHSSRCQALLLPPGPPTVPA